MFELGASRSALVRTSASDNKPVAHANLAHESPCRGQVCATEDVAFSVRMARRDGAHRARRSVGRGALGGTWDVSGRFRNSAQPECGHEPFVLYGAACRPARIRECRPARRTGAPRPPGRLPPLGPGISSCTFHSGDESHARVHIEGTSPAKAALHCFPSTPLIERPTLQGMSIQRALMANVPERRDGSRAHRSLPRWGQRRRPIILRFVQVTLPPASGTH